MSKTTSMRWPWRLRHQRLRWPDMTQKIPVIVRISQAQPFSEFTGTCYIDGPRVSTSRSIAVGQCYFSIRARFITLLSTGRGPSGGPARKRTKFMNDTNEKWCGRGDSNPHECYFTATSTLRVYQFRHDRRSESVMSI